MKGRNEQSCDYLRKNILDKGHTGRQRPDGAGLVGHGKGLGVCSACEGVTTGKVENDGRGWDHSGCSVENGF